MLLHYILVLIFSKVVMDEHYLERQTYQSHQQALPRAPRQQRSSVVIILLGQDAILVRITCKSECKLQSEEEN